MDRFHAIEAFVKVVETGSFARAAERLGVSVSSVSRHVAELEAHLDARLLNRTTRRLSLTEIGSAFHERCVQLLADLEEAEESAGAGTVVPRGTLRLTCDVTFGTRYLAPAIAAFMARYPQVRFDVELSGAHRRPRRRRVRRRGAHRRRRRPESRRAQGRRRRRLVCCAAPAYLAQHGEPRAPEDLAAHACLDVRLLAAERPLALPRPRGARAQRARSRVPRTPTTGGFLEALAVAGLGIMLRARLHRRTRRARGAAGADPARIRAAGVRHPRRLPEPAPPVGEGARVHRVSRATVHRRRMGARGSPWRRRPRAADDGRLRHFSGSRSPA